MNRSERERSLFLLTRTAMLVVAGIALSVIVLPAETAYSADIIIAGDVQYKPVSAVVSAIKSSASLSTKVYSIAQARGRLASIVADEEARIVVALGKDMLDEALELPPSVTVIYGLVIVPPKSSRQNLAGVYMSTPVSEYVNIVRRYLPSIKKIAVFGGAELINLLDGAGHDNVALHRVTSPGELIASVNRLSGSQAILLMPDVSVLTSSALENVFLFSYRKNMPLFGISEINVKQGALMAVVFDPASISEQISDMVARAARGEDPRRLGSLPPRRYHININVTTAKKMGIAIPEELLSSAYRVYQ